MDVDFGSDVVDVITIGVPDEICIELLLSVSDVSLVFVMKVVVVNIVDMNLVRSVDTILVDSDVLRTSGLGVVATVTLTVVEVDSVEIKVRILELISVGRTLLDLGWNVVVKIVSVVKSCVTIGVLNTDGLKLLDSKIVDVVVVSVVVVLSVRTEVCSVNKEE